jgi:hypothetical protein
MNGSEFNPDEYWKDKICQSPLQLNCDEYEQDTTKCKKCGQDFRSEDNHFTLEDLENICEDCVCCMIDAEDNRDERNQVSDEKGDSYAKCAWCEDLYPISEMKEEKEMGYLCDWCVQGILSHGEQLTIVYGG